MTCAQAIRATLLAGSTARHPVTGRPLFAFRLHQFLSKGDTVYVSLEDEARRHITVAVPGHGARPARRRADAVGLLPGMRSGVLWWSRGSTDGSDVSTDPGATATPAAATRPTATSTSRRLSRGPPTRSRRAGCRTPGSSDGDVARAPTAKYLPRRVRVDADGSEVTAGGIDAAFVPAPFRFCLRCKVSYEQARGNDFAKLATLDAEGRSSAVTVLSTSIVRCAATRFPTDELSAESANC